MAGSRFPGSRVIAFDHLPRGPSGAPVVRLVVGYPPTVAGAAAELSVETNVPHSLEESLRTLPVTKLASSGKRVNSLPVRQSNAIGECVFPNKNASTR